VDERTDGDWIILDEGVMCELLPRGWEIIVTFLPATEVPYHKSTIGDLLRVRVGNEMAERNNV
jgi:hypothetical protein